MIHIVPLTEHKAQDDEADNLVCDTGSGAAADCW